MEQKKNYTLPIVMMFLLFAMISFVTGLSNPLGVIVKNQFAVANWMSQLGNFANFIAYAVMGIPAGMMLKRIGYKKTALAAVVAGMLVNPAFAADKTLQWEVDQSAGISAADNVTITETGGITLNKTYTDDGFSQTNENTKFTARKTLTNSGYVRGDAKLEAAKIVNNAQGEIEMGTVEILSPTATEVITNAGTFSADTLTTGVGNVTNTGKMTVKNAYDLQGKLTNSGTQLKIGTANVTGELANSAKTGATVDVLNVQGTGRVTGTGTLTATGAVDIATGASLAQ